MKMKRILSFLFALVLISSILSVTAFAASASFTLSGSATVTVGNQVKVTVKLSSAEKIGSWRFSLTYDPSVLEYVSGADSGGGGAVSFADSSDGITSLSKTVTFRTKKIGNTTVSVSSAQVVSFDTVSNMSVNIPSKKISVVAAPNLSGENLLSALSVSEGELTPAFVDRTTDYTISVPYETTSITVYATAKDNKAKITVSPSDALAVGENKIEIVVTAENGSKKTYTVTVTRAQSELAGNTVDLDGTTFTVAHDPTTLTVPANYTETTALYGEKKILVFSSPRDSLRIAYLFNESSGSWYIYNEAKQSFSEYRAVPSASNTVVLLALPENLSIPEGFLPHELLVGEQTWSVYKAENSKEEGIWLVYGMDADGNCDFFYYDEALATFASYFEPAEDTEEAEAKEREINKLQSLLNESESKADQMEIFFLAASAIATLLLIFLIIALVVKKKKPKENKEKKEEPEKKADKEEMLSQLEKISESIEYDPTAQAPKRRRARRTIEEIGRKDEPIPPQMPTEESATEKSENKGEKREDPYSGNDMPTILR